MIGWRQSRQSVREREDGHEEDEQRPPRHASGQDSNQRSADHNTQCISADDMTGGRCADAEVACKERQQAHGRELGRPDCEAAHG